MQRINRGRSLKRRRVTATLPARRAGGDATASNNSREIAAKHAKSQRTWQCLLVLMACGGLLLTSPSVAADLEILSSGTRYGIDFDSTVANVNVGAFDGSGVTASPVAGQLDATSWAFDGFSSVDDLSRGTSTGGVSSGGLYAFDHSSDATPNMLLGVQPTGSDFTPGSMTLGILNNSGESLSSWNIDYDVLVFNNGDRSSSLNLSYAIGSGEFQEVPELNYMTAEVSDNDPAWMATNQATTLLAEVGQGEQLFLRWTSDDVSGGGSRDEFGIDNIGVKGVSVAAVPEPSHVLGLAVASSLGLFVRYRHWRARRRTPNTNERHSEQHGSA